MPQNLEKFADHFFTIFTESLRFFIITDLQEILFRNIMIKIQV